MLNESRAVNVGVSNLQRFALAVILIGTTAMHAGLVASVCAVDGVAAGHLEQP